MASILFDDIAFPRELYDPDTLEFVPPISTLLSFAPHILSQLHLPESEQEPLPVPPPTPNATQKGSNGEAKTQPSHIQQQQQQQQKQQDDSQGFFDKLKGAASSRTGRQLFSDGAYMAGRYMHGAAASSSSSTRTRTYDNDYYYTRLRQEEPKDGRYYTHSQQARQASSSTSSPPYFKVFPHLNALFGFQQNDSSERDQERARLRELEERLEAFEREYERQDMYSRREQERINQERRQLVQELEEHRKKVKKLEKALQEEQDAKKKSQEKSEEEKEKTKKKEEDKKKKEDEKDKEDKETKEEKQKDGQVDTVAKTNDPDLLVMAVVGVTSLAVALYSAHRASKTYSTVSFHDQLEILLDQCRSVIQSAEAWMSEQVLEVPQQMREDVIMIKELLDSINRLDARSEKKAETVAWSGSALGSLGVLGGVALSSMTAVASGGTLIVGCALYGIVSRARYNGVEYKAARTMVELKVAQLLKVLGTGDYNPALQNTSIFGKQSQKNSEQQGSSLEAPAKGGAAYQRRLEKLRLQFQRRASEEMADADEVTDLQIEAELQRLQRVDRAERSTSSSSPHGQHSRGTTENDAELLFDAEDLHGIKAPSNASTHPSRRSHIVM
ncbi:hypothetical protein BGW41_002320 [Actinomortierella wolfii]|nr:hypothetical protein BGW41_002320 [Actinomortierella wolfii]